MDEQPNEFQTVLEAVSHWPAERRATLAHALIESLTREASFRRKKPTADQLIGLLRGEDPPPDDEKVRQWIDEYRTRKYG